MCLGWVHFTCRSRLRGWVHFRADNQMGKKRANREGTIYQRPDGRWTAQLPVGYDWVTGKVTRKTVYGATQAEAKAKLDALKKQEEGKDEANMKLAYAIDTWLADRGRHCDNATVVNYTQSLQPVKEDPRNC